MPYSTKTIKKIPIILALAFAPFFFAHAQTASTASTDTLQSDLSRLTESLDLLNAIKTGKRPTDATSLQSALNNVISISEEEIRSVSMQLGAHSELTDEEISLQDDLMADLASLKLHIKSVRTDTTQESGISAVISIAQKFKEWRDGTYTDTMARAVRFISVFENEDSVKAGNGRLASIVKDTKKIRSLLPGMRSAPFMSLIKKSQDELKKAVDLNARAKASLLSETNEAEDEETIDEMVRQSNALVNAAYDDFITMSRLIRK